MGGVDGAAPPGATSPRRIAIVGVGLIGGSMALALRDADPHLRLVAVDRGAALDRAAALGVFERVGEDLETLRGAETIVLAAPVRQNVEVVRRLTRLTGERVLVTDTGSTKRSIVEAAASLPPHVSFVGGHPLAGSTQGGAGAARADLFRRRRWLVTPCAATRSPADADAVAALAVRCGAEPRTIDAEAHDRLVAALSHVPQLTASALMSVIGDAVGREDLSLAGPGLADATRLAGSPPEIWQDICATNADAIAPLLDALIATLQRMRGDLAGGAAIADVFSAARRYRSAVD